MQAFCFCIQTGKTVNDVDRMEFQTDEFYLKSTDECMTSSPWCRKPVEHQQNCRTVHL